MPSPASPGASSAPGSSSPWAPAYHGQATDGAGRWPRYAARVRRILPVLLVGALAVGHACTGKRAPDTTGDAGDAGDSGNGNGNGNGNEDGGDGGDAGTPLDAGCLNDSACGAARWCEVSTGICRDAKACPQGQGNCDYQGFGADYCANQGCYCDPGDTSCKPRH